jgi:hypothetical protein
MLSLSLSNCHFVRYCCDGDEDENSGNEWIDRVYDRKVLCAPKKQIHAAIPQSIEDVLAEAVMSSPPRATFILCRAVLEEICNDFVIPTEQQSSKGNSRYIKLHDRLSMFF